MSSATVTVTENPRRNLPLFLREPWPVAAVIALLACLLMAFGADPFRSLDRNWGDALLRLRFQLGREPPPDSRVFLVGIESDDLKGASTEAEYQTYAETLNILADLQIAAVGMDLIMLDGLESDSQGVREAIRNNGHVVLAEARMAKTVVRSFPFADRPLPAGLINIVPDPDGVNRRYSYGVATDSICEPSLALSVYLESLRQSANCEAGVFVWKELAADAITLAERKSRAGSAPLNFRSPYTERWPEGFKSISARVLRAKYKEWQGTGADPNKVPADLPTRGNLVLIGSVATGSGDAGATPFGNYEPFIQLHATALNDLLQGRPLRELSPAGNIGFTVAALLLIAIKGRWLRGIPGLVLTSVFLVLAVLATSAVLLVRADMMMAGVTPAAFMAVYVLCESGRRTNLASFEKAQLRDTLGRYFSPSVLEDVLENPEAMQPREAELTVLLTDLRNFTAITEQFGTRRIFDLLNDFFEVETNAVLALDGSMEHFLGDQFLAYWGAPRAQPDAADRALQSAENMIRGLDALQETLEPGVKQLFGYGVAVHCGTAAFGNKGTRAKLDYGILGDVVNSAARIESLTKHYRVRQIVTREVIEKATKKPTVRLLDRIRVKGKAKPLELFEVLLEPSEQKMATVRRYEDAWQEYARGNFPEAVAVFDELTEYDYPSRVLADRCRELIGSSPLNWDGGYWLKEK